MDVSIQETKTARQATPVYAEPYTGFFAEKGFTPPRAFGLCDFEDVLNRSIDVRVSGLAQIGPSILENRVLFIQTHAGDHSVCLAYRDGTEYGFGKNNVKVRLTELSRIAEMESSGKDGEGMLKDMMQSLADAKANAWLGYVVTIGTGEGNKTVVLEEDFSGAREKVSGLVDFAVDAAREIYSQVEESRLAGLSDSLSGLRGKFMRIVEEKGYAGDMNAVKEAVDEFIQETGVEFQCRGVDGIHNSYRKKIEEYCAAHDLSIVPSASGTEFRKKEYMDAIEDYLR